MRVGVATLLRSVKRGLQRACGAGGRRRTMTSYLNLFGSENSTGLMGSGRVRRHPAAATDPPHHAACPAVPALFGSGSPNARRSLAWERRRHFGDLLKLDK